MDGQKIAIIGDGGGAAGAFLAGFMVGLHRLSVRRLDYYVGPSASASTFAYVSASQFLEEYEIWANQIPNPLFISEKNVEEGRPFVDVEYLSYKVFGEKIILDQKGVRNSKTRLIIPVTNVETGEPEYFDNRNGIGILELLCATMNLAIFSGNNFPRIRGKLYFDGIYGNPIPLRVSGIPEIEKARKIVVLSDNLDLPPLETTQRDRFSSRLVVRGLRNLREKYPRVYELFVSYRDRYGDRVREAESLADVVVKPPRRLSPFDNSPNVVKKAIIMGFEVAVSDPRVLSFVGELKESSRADFYFSL